MENNRYVIVPLLQAFYWFDDGMQNYLRARGWPQVTRPQSMVMLNIVSNITRPSDIARNLGISRQAVHMTINQMVELGLVQLEDDPDDRRTKRVVISRSGESVRKDARRAVDMLTRELAGRIGADNVRKLQDVFSLDWGEPPRFD